MGGSEYKYTILCDAGENNYTVHERVAGDIEWGRLEATRVFEIPEAIEVTHPVDPVILRHIPAYLYEFDAHPSALLPVHPDVFKSEEDVKSCLAHDERGGKSKITPVPPEPQQMLSDNGFVIIKSVIPDKLRSDLMDNYIRNYKEKTEKIFNAGDKGRAQGHLKPRKAGKGDKWKRRLWMDFSEKPVEEQQIYKVVGDVVRRYISPRHLPRQPVYLVSDQGSGRQQAHRDYDEVLCGKRRDQLRDGGTATASSWASRKVPASSAGPEATSTTPRRAGSQQMLLSSDCHTGKREKSDARAGDLLIFADTLAHAGSGYDKKNACASTATTSSRKRPTASTTRGGSSSSTTTVIRSERAMRWCTPTRRWVRWSKQMEIASP